MPGFWQLLTLQPLPNPSLGMYQDIHPNWEIIIEINTSLEMMKDGWFGGFVFFVHFRAQSSQN